MEIKTKYITPDDFKAYFGIDLHLALCTNDNPSDADIAFIYRIEKRVETYINSMFNRIIEREYPEFTDYQKEHYQLALLEQAKYVFKNGEISEDSGLDYERGEVLSNRTIDTKTIAPNCKKELILCGLWDRNIRPIRRIWRGLW